MFESIYRYSVDSPTRAFDSASPSPGPSPAPSQRSSSHPSSSPRASTQPSSQSPSHPSSTPTTPTTPHPETASAAVDDPATEEAVVVDDAPPVSTNNLTTASMNSPASSAISSPSTPFLPVVTTTAAVIADTALVTATATAGVGPLSRRESHRSDPSSSSSEARPDVSGRPYSSSSPSRAGSRRGVLDRRTPPPSYGAVDSIIVEMPPSSETEGSNSSPTPQLPTYDEAMAQSRS